MSFKLHPQLEADCFHVLSLDLCQVLLMGNALFPWIVLVPQRDNIRELHELDEGDYALAMLEMRECAQALQKMTKATKINVAALGNMVPQLHIHIIARYQHDPAWPNPVWNSGLPSKQYTAGEQSTFAKAFCHHLHLIQSA